MVSEFLACLFLAILDRTMLARVMQWGRTKLPAYSNWKGVDGGGSIPADCEELVEGLARVIFQKGCVFYNPVQVVNRDLSVLVIRWLQRQRPNRDLRILEALSATGLRAIRYAKEIPRVSHVLANDLEPSAVQTIARNVAHNGGGVEGVVVPNCGDAISVMTAARAPQDQYDVVDLDPYGGAAPFLDSAVQAVRNGGLLAVTCTDLAVLCGNSPEICFARYGAAPLKGPHTHEMAVRIVLHAINSAANRHGRSIEVVLCTKIDFYVRLFVRLRDSRAVAQLTHSRTSSVLQCTSCGTFRLQPLGRVRDNATSNSKKKRRKCETSKGEEKGDKSAKPGSSTDGGIPAIGCRKFSVAPVVDGMGGRCSICSGTLCVGGPIWAGPLADVKVCHDILEEIATGVGAFQARDRVDALLRVAAEEIQEAPLFLQLNTMVGVLKTNAPPAAALRTCLTAKGYQVSQSHTDSLALKTTAPPEILWDLLRLWALDSRSGGAGAKKRRSRNETCGNGAKEETGKNINVSTMTPGERILAQAPSLVKAEDIDFSIKKDAWNRKSGDKSSAPRFLPNPEANWGPKSRAQPSSLKRKHSDVG